MKQANRVYGDDGGSLRSIEPPKLMNVADKPQFWCVGEVTLEFDGRTVVHQDIGIDDIAGRGSDLKVHAADMAMKGCVTDAMKRCRRTGAAQSGTDRYRRATTPDAAPVPAPASTNRVSSRSSRIRWRASSS